MQVAFAGVMALCAVLVTAKVFTQQPPPPPPPPPTSVTEFESAPGWRTYAAKGNRIGPADAKVVILELTDYQCPACARFEPTIRAVQEKYPRDVAVIYRHYPLDRPHPNAHAAAIASECAATQGSFESMHHTLFKRHRDFGSISWREFASEAGVPALDRFDGCMKDSSTAFRVAEDRKFAADIEAKATPTLFVNDVRFTGSVHPETLDSLVRVALRLPIAR